MTRILRRALCAVAATAIAVLGALPAASPASALAPTSCPEGDGWVRVTVPADGATPVTVTPPDGSLIIDICIAAGPDVTLLTFDPGTADLTVPASRPDAQGVPQPVSECSYRATSAPAPEPTPDPAPPAPVASPEPQPAPAVQPAPATQAGSATPAAGRARRGSTTTTAPVTEPTVVTTPAAATTPPAEPTARPTTAAQAPSLGSVTDEAPAAIRVLSTRVSAGADQGAVSHGSPVWTVAPAAALVLAGVAIVWLRRARRRQTD